MKTLQHATFNFFKNDKQTQQYYIDKYKISKKIYIDILKETLDYCFNSEFNPFLDEKYLDISYLLIDDYIINLDDIDEVLNENLREYVEELQHARNN